MNKFKYLQGDKILLPYVPETRNLFDEDTLVRVYQRIKEDDLMSLVFHDNPDITLNQFVAYFSTNLVNLAFFCVVENEVEQLAGMCWLTESMEIQGKVKRGNASFLFFKKYQTPKITSALGKMGLDYWFNQLHYTNIIGLTPDLNRSAIIYVRRLGFKEVGRIVNYSVLFGCKCAGVITYMDTELYQKKYGETDG